MRRATAAIVPLAAALLAATACGAPTSGRSAEELWNDNCVRCHGADGTGVRAMRGLEPGIDLTRSRLVGDRARGVLFQRIAYGYGSMPGFAHRLQRGDIELLVAYVMQLAAR